MNKIANNFLAIKPIYKSIKTTKSLNFNNYKYQLEQNQKNLNLSKIKIQNKYNNKTATQVSKENDVYQSPFPKNNSIYKIHKELYNCRNIVIKIPDIALIYASYLISSNMVLNLINKKINNSINVGF